MTDASAIIHVKNFVEGDRVMVGKGKIIWRVAIVGRQVLTLRPASGKQNRVLYVSNYDADDRLKKVYS